jgi:hypothetical protein
MVIAAVGAAALVAGCATQGSGTSPTPSPSVADNGVSAMSANEILEKAKTAVGAVDSFHMKGAALEDAEKVELDFQVKGDDVGGSMTVSGMTIEIIRVGNDAYIKADTLFQTLLGSQPQLLNLIKGKYVKVNAADERFKQFTQISNPEELLKPEGTVSKGEAKTINGKQAIALIDDKDKSKLYIATVGEPLPLRIEDESGANGLDFTYDETVTITAPPADQVVDASQLPGF